MSKHWKRFAAVVVSLTMAFQFCVNDFYAYAETTTPEQETVEQTPPEQQTQPEPEVTTEPVETPAQTEPIQEPAPEVETETTTPPEQEQPQQPAQEQTPAQPEREVAGTLKLEFKDEEGNTLKTVDPIALTNKYVGDTIRLTDLGVDTNVADYTLVDIKDKNDGTKDYNPNSVDFTLTKNITELQLVYRANPKEPETTPTENDTNTTEDSQQGEGEEDSEADPDEADQPKKASRASARSITSDGNVTTISVGQTITLSDDEGSSFGISDSWSASPNDRVSISGEGRTATVTGLKAGKVTITHSWGIMGLGDSNTFTLEVVASVDVESVGIQKDGQSIDTLALSTGDEVTLSASVEPDNASNTEVTRKSNDSEVVSVEPDGTVTALKEGSAEITVTSLDDSEISDTITVTVKDVAPTSMNVTAEGSTGNTATITKSGKVKLAVHFEPENTTNQKVEWASQNEEVATVDEDGLVTGVSNGEATITATSLEDENVTAEFTVKVDEIMMTDFQVVTDDSDNTVTVGETLNVRAIIKPDDYPNKEVKWKSSDPEVATVDDNGLVTTLKTGTVVITGTSVADSTATASVTILVEAKKVTDVKITGYDREYLITGQNVQLSAEVTPEDAADKHITWTSLDEDVLTVDQNGKVTATGQGTAIIRAENLATGVYDEIEITVYNSQPRTQEVQIWVTNSYQNQNVTINVPVDGTSVNVADAIPSFFSTSEKSYSFTGMVKTRIRNNQDSWAQIQNAPTVALLRVKNGKIQYSTTEAGSDWQNLNYKITAHYDLVYSGEDDSSDIEVVVGDWPYDKNHDATNKIIQIQIKDSETGETVYDSGNMWYDNGSNGDYGKIRFNCDESRYEVTNIRVLKYDSQNDRNPEVIDEDAEEPYSVDFSSRKGYEKYLVIATVSPKEFRVSYNANGGEGDVPASYTLTATNGNQVTVASTPTPTKDRYIFGGWEYDGKTYYGGESFEMPPENVTFVAKWIEASQVISYESNNTEWGTVNRSYDRVNEFTEIQGSLAAAKEGYRFVKWIDKETNQEVSKERFYLPTKDNAGKTFVAVFEQNTYTITTKVSNGTISPTKTVNYNGSYTVNYRPNEGYTLKSVIVDGVDVTTTNPESYTFNNVKEAHEITVVYERDTSDFSAEGFNVEYDGENHNIDTKGTLIAGEKWQYSYDENMWYDNPSAVNYINVSDSKNTVYLRVVQNDDVIYNTTVSAIITQAPVTVTVVGNHDSVEYDGIEHSVEGYTISDDSDLYNEETNVEFTGTAKATRTDEGTTKMKLTEAQFKNTDNNFNVTFSITDGYITITSKSIAPDPEDPENTMSVEGPSDVVYNGQEQKEEPVVKDGEKVLEKGVDYKLEYTENGDYTNVGEKTVKVIGINNYGGDFEVTYEITQAPVTVTTESATQVYDGTALTAPGSIEGLVNNETATLNVTGSQTNVGSSKNTASIVWDGTADKNNYEVTNDFGTLTVTKQSINPEDPDDPSSYKNVTVNNPSDVTYDGNSHQWKPTVTSGNTTLTEGTDYTVSYSTTDFTNVTDIITVTIEGTGNYRGTVTRTYQINPRAITLTSAGGTKTYDGTALTNGTVTLTGELVDPSDITYRATGTQTEVGSSLNTIEVNYASDQMRNNYEVTLVTGTLTVNAAPVTPTTPTTPGGGEGTGTTPATGGPVAAADDDADAEDEPEEEEVEDEETPLSDGEEEVDEGKTPLAKIDVWALINLIAAIITVLFGLILLLSKRHKNDDEEDEEERQARIERGEEKEQEQKRGWICKVLGVLVAIGSVVLFILTEDMSLPMAMTDEWTIWMIIIAVVELVLLLVGRHWKDVDDDEEEQAQA
ncbi:Ig-like domain-containing protein [Faecalicoccus acidiformans]|uniref:Ig-like domain-containing protein n=1 Tax=Faecalicoccus acidiformans TaxID=915173 RepID=UPI00320939EA